MPRPRFWTQEETDKLERLFDEKHSIPMMCKKMGMTKNMVVGKLHRMKLRGSIHTEVESKYLFPDMIEHVQLPPRDWSPN